ncbi:MAG: phosphatase PAP2 family protein [Deltaproteobacteria bacterium]
MDEAIVRAVNAWSADPWVAGWANFASSPWMVVLVCTPTALYLLYKRRFMAVASIALSMGVGDVVTARILKPSFARERPCRTLDGLVKVSSCGVGKSFPSGHATVAFAFYVPAARAVPYGWAIYLPAASAVAFSRVQLGVHYPTDIFAGAFVGSVIGIGGIVAGRRAQRRKSGRTDSEDTGTG